MPVSLPPWSYTHLDTYENCPFQYHWKYILKNKEAATKEMEDGRKTHDALEKRVAANVALPGVYVKYDPLCQSVLKIAGDNNGTIRTEMKVAINRELKPCDFFAKDVYGRGALDIGILAPDPTPDRAIILDWKTGKTREKDFQVSIFAFFTFLHFPTVQNVSAMNIWLPTLKAGELYKYTRGDLPAIWANIYLKLAAMELSAANDTWVKRASPLCAYCPVLTCENNRSKK